MLRAVARSLAMGFVRIFAARGGAFCLLLRARTFVLFVRDLLECVFFAKGNFILHIWAYLEFRGNLL